MSRQSKMANKRRARDQQVGPKGKRSRGPARTTPAHGKQHRQPLCPTRGGPGNSRQQD